MKILYYEIGSRIRQARKSRHLSQEQLAELVDVGTTHISHVETGNSIPSLKLFIEIVNALDISADDLLCDQLSHAGHIFSKEIAAELEDCNERELRIIADTIRALKTSLRRR